jgi:hypothetical protein
MKTTRKQAGCTRLYSSGKELFKVAINSSDNSIQQETEKANKTEIALEFLGAAASHHVHACFPAHSVELKDYCQQNWKRPEKTR